MHFNRVTVVVVVCLVDALYRLTVVVVCLMDVFS